ncbi:hypothetical protein [Burkholderia cenocepacia]|uniref:hypothetical protein n=1 Tax=Burkholderia cenocepacia TaxID=95486 RepID=UPI002AB7A4C4|nr:hypothetical protein [Burkholderia cenocepacia]
MRNEQLQPICGTDLERWRIENGLTKVAAADAFGLQKAKWEELTSAENSVKQIADPVVAMLLHLYTQFPESAPVKLPPPDVKEFYDDLGLQDTPQDRDKFATLIGRSPPSVYRLLLHNGTPGRPVVRWIEAVRRLKLTPKKSLRLMADVVSSVGDRQHVDKVLIQGWTKQGDTGEHE